MSDDVDKKIEEFEAEIQVLQNEPGADYSESSYLPPSMMNDVRNAMAKNLADNGPEEKEGALASLPTMQIEDVQDKYTDLFNDTTLKAMEEKVTNMVELEDDGTVNQVRYLGKMTDLDNIDEAAAVVVEHLNELSDAGFVKGTLLPLSVLHLNIPSSETKKAAALAYVMLSADGVKYFDEKLGDVRIQEGGLPNEL